MDRREIVSIIMKCPVCACGMYVGEDGRSAFCTGARRHCFDFSADGYLSLSGGGGDSKGAVAARTRFLSKGHYSTAADVIVDAVSKYVSSDATVIDAGCGEGYYTEMLARKCGGVLGFDLSKFACSAASKRAKRDGIQNVLYATASVFELPVADGAADAVVNIFAPCAEDEYSRVLREGGYLFVVGAGKDHLMGLKRVLYENTYENGERADLPQSMSFVERITSSAIITVSGYEDIEALFSMTPYYWRTGESDRQKLEAIESLTTEIEFEINIYKK